MQNSQPSSLPSLVPSEPDPRVWFHLERQQALQQTVGPAFSLLRQSGLLRASLGYWVRWQASLEFTYWTDEEESRVLDSLIESWSSSPRSKELNLSEPEIRAKLRVNPALERWSSSQWQHRVESLFLKRKDALDKASCLLLRVKDKHLALELYHRIKADEISFEHAAREFSCGPESSNGGIIPLQPVESLPYGLSGLLKELQLGRLMMPSRLGNDFAIVKLNEFCSARLDNKVEKSLIAEQLQLWTDSVVDHILSVLK